MRTVRIEGADPKPLAAPSDWTEENGHCGGLFIRREVVDGVAYMTSAWEPESTEAALMYAGARIHLGVAGSGHPVVSMGLSALPEAFDPVVLARHQTAPDGTAQVRVEMIFPAEGGRRAFAVVTIDRSLADAVAIGVESIENLARGNGWIE